MTPEVLSSLVPVSPAQETAVTSGAVIPAWIEFVAVGGAVTAMLLGMWLVFARTKESAAPFSAGHVKALGLVLFLPTLLIVTVVHTDFGSESLSALLGAVAGYVLSHASGGRRA